MLSELESLDLYSLMGTFMSLVSETSQVTGNHPMVRLDIAKFPLPADGTEYTQLKTNIAIYWYGTYAICIIIFIMSAYVSWGFAERELI